jgi:hypothetical protein
MRPFVLLIGVLFIGVMMMSITGLIREGAKNYNATIPKEYNNLYYKLNESFDVFGNKYSQEQVAGVEGKGIVTDSATSEKTLEGGFSFLIGLFKLPQQIQALITIVGGYLGVPAWAIGATFVFLFVGILAGIISIIFRLGDA